MLPDLIHLKNTHTKNEFEIKISFFNKEDERFNVSIGSSYFTQFILNIQNYDVHLYQFKYSKNSAVTISNISFKKLLFIH